MIKEQVTEGVDEYLGEKFAWIQIETRWCLGDLDGCEAAAAQAVYRCRQAEARGYKPVAMLQTRRIDPDSGIGEPDEWIHVFEAQYKRILNG